MLCQPRVCSERTLESFLQLDVIGEGGFGTVFRSQDVDTGEIVAIKMMSASEKNVQEIELLCLLYPHPFIVQLREVVFDPAEENPDKPLNLFMVLEYVTHDLRSLLRSWLFDEDLTRYIMHQLLQGIAHLHRSGIVHRDIKTANTLVTGAASIKICDFGLAKRFDTAKPHLSFPGRYFGTLPYCAPELLHYKTTKYYSAAIDMWSAGCVMAELLCREPLFRGHRDLDATDQLEQIYALLGMPDRYWKTCPPEPVMLQRLRDKFPPSMLSVHGFNLLSRMLHPDPHKRITAEEAIFHPWFSSHP